MYKRYAIFIIFLIAALPSVVNAQNPGDELFDDSYIHEIRIQFEESNFWQILTQNYQDNSPIFGGVGGEIPYLMATTIEVDGEITDSIGLRQKGFSSHFHLDQIRNL